MKVVGHYSKELQDHLREKETKSCPACGSEQGGTCTGLLVLHDIAPMPGTPPIPTTAVVPLICMDCGYTMMFFAAQLGLA